MEKKMIKSCQKLQKDNEDRMLVICSKMESHPIYGFCRLLVKEKQIDDSWIS